MRNTLRLFLSLLIYSELRGGYGTSAFAQLLAKKFPPKMMIGKQQQQRQGPVSRRQTPSKQCTTSYLQQANTDSTTTMMTDQEDGESNGTFAYDFAMDDVDDYDSIVLEWNATNFTASPLSLAHLSETFSANVSYFYLQKELNLSEKALWGVVFDANSALTMRPEVLRRKVQVLQDTANLSLDDVRLVLERKPTTLHLSADRNLAPTILFLQRSFDFSKAELRKVIVDCPALLSYSLQNLHYKVLFFTSMMQFTLSEVRALVARQPNILRASVETGLIPHMRFWCEDLQFSLHDLRTLVLANPLLLMYSLENNLVPKCIYLLLMKLEMTTQQVQRILLRYPKFCDQNLERVIGPMVVYFLNDLDFPTYTVATMLVRFPRLVTHSLDGKIKGIIGYLRYELGLPAESVEKIVSRSPAILGLNLQSLQEKVACLQTMALRSNNPEHLNKVITAMPSLLTVSMESNLQPKITFLQGSGVNVTQAVLKLPAILGYSLERRLQPRVTALYRAGLDVNAVLCTMMPLTDPGFAKRLAAIEQKQRKEQPKLVDASGRITHWVR